jgi:hypothetical protein
MNDCVNTSNERRVIVNIYTLIFIVILGLEFRNQKITSYLHRTLAAPYTLRKKVSPAFQTTQGSVERAMST